MLGNVCPECKKHIRFPFWVRARYDALYSDFESKRWPYIWVMLYWHRNCIKRYFKKAPQHIKLRMTANPDDAKFFGYDPYERQTTEDFVKQHGYFPDEKPSEPDQI